MISIFQLIFQCQKQIMKDNSLFLFRTFFGLILLFFQHSFRILEALSATGLRSIRYAKEISGVTEVVANDLSRHAVEIIKRNVEDNKVGQIVTPNLADAT